MSQREYFPQSPEKFGQKKERKKKRFSLFKYSHTRVNRATNDCIDIVSGVLLKKLYMKVVCLQHGNTEREKTQRQFVVRHNITAIYLTREAP